MATAPIILFGWWLVWTGTFLCFDILRRITPTDFHIFQRGRSTTNQIFYPDDVKPIIIKYDTIHIYILYYIIYFIISTTIIYVYIMILAPTLQQLAAAELLGGGMEPLPHAAGQGEGEGVTDSAQKRGKTPCRGYQWIIYIYT